jgi:hypothetical protein
MGLVAEKSNTTTSLDRSFDMVKLVQQVDFDDIRRTCIIQLRCKEVQQQSAGAQKIGIWECYLITRRHAIVVDILHQKLEIKTSLAQSSNRRAPAIGCRT